MPRKERAIYSRANTRSYNITAPRHCCSLFDAALLVDHSSSSVPFRLIVLLLVILFAPFLFSVVCIVDLVLAEAAAHYDGSTGNV